MLIVDIVEGMSGGYYSAFEFFETLVLPCLTITYFLFKIIPFILSSFYSKGTLKL